MKPPKGVVPDEVRDNFTFIRKGKVGDWRNFFKDESKLKEFDQWIQNNNTLDIPIKYVCTHVKHEDTCIHAVL